eukprot:CAMPEP_0182894208 /NCGR_PEP_ID=MMETSP0034_2-20130328/24940_1 /TAXON_ID=156128 /ORGANISM="Nephroselmis pyriformis, Strain CCMP717" /LENGTH=129 /DNA_ID=CAMNT_0025027987 /DNA_START=24 /DNA_END=409 /DNA_ORIENTATION=-
MMRAWPPVGVGGRRGLPLALLVATFALIAPVLCQNATVGNVTQPPDAPPLSSPPPSPPSPPAPYDPCVVAMHAWTKSTLDCPMQTLVDNWDGSSAECIEVETSDAVNYGRNLSLPYVAKETLNDTHTIV